MSNFKCNNCGREWDAAGMDLMWTEFCPICESKDIKHIKSEMPNFINLTPHEIKVLDKDNNVIVVLSPSGTIARATSKKMTMGYLGDIPVIASSFGEVIDLPEPVDATYYIVSSLTAQAAEGRTDLLVTEDTVRNEAGQIIGCRAFGKILY
jgi:hypothetical protein